MVLWKVKEMRRLFAIGGTKTNFSMLLCNYGCTIGWRLVGIITVIRWSHLVNLGVTEGFIRAIFRHFRFCITHDGRRTSVIMAI